MSWSSKWPSHMTAPWPNVEEMAKPLPEIIGWDLGATPSKTILSKGDFHTELKKDGSNLIDGEKNLYFQCEGCEILFDPATKSFATLHDFAHKQGWKVKWNINGLGYKIYCPKCVGNIANG